MNRRGWCLLILLAACTRSQDPETLADIAAADGNWPEAVELLARATPTARVVGKRAEAAFQAGDLRAAAVGFQHLAELAPERSGEAAAGLARTAALAGRRGDQLSLRTAILGLRQIAPQWPVGRLAAQLSIPADAPPGEVMALVPALLAGSPPVDVAHGSLLALGLAQRDQFGCDAARPVLDALSERVEGELGRSLLDARAGCQWEAGVAALGSGDTLAARRLLDATVAMDPAGVAGRRALITLGDVYLREGDPFAAQIAWRTAASAANPDSITVLALERLRTMPGAPIIGEPDSL